MTLVSDLHDRAAGRPSGFDYLRLVLALSVVVWHTVDVNYGSAFALQLWASPLKPLPALILPMFFALSGFLVAGSLLRSKTIASFLYLRCIRIFPALCFEVALSALLLGPLFTSFSLDAYFRDPQFRHYLLNVVGDIHYSLPGVFTQNPLPNLVNLQLWTIPYELRCYIAAAVLGTLGFHKRPILFLAAAICLQVFMAQRAYAYGAFGTTIPGNVLVLCFLFGIVMYLYRSAIPHNGAVAVACLVLYVALDYIPCGGYFVAAPVAYLTTYLGVFNPARTLLPKSGDYSYGVYLFGFPIQQTIAALAPWSHRWELNLALSAPLIALAAICSWRFVERPALSLRNLQTYIDDAARRALAGLASALPEGWFKARSLERIRALTKAGL